ncbi:MAG: potassium-transporting ATPase subunit KdpC [Nitrospirae bacterium]|nr:potassium-transporting ATPase subunit KdpC [Nitrospirota bacterium]
MNDLKPAILTCLVFTILLGGVYPAAVTAISHAMFPYQAAGSFLTGGTGRITGSALIGQQFSDPKYFHSRPSATAGFAYNPLASGGSNLGPTNPDFLKQVGDRVAALRESGISGGTPDDLVPADLALASASGLDPHISPEAALAQIRRVAKARGMTEDALKRLVNARVQDRDFGILGSPRVNVLELNMELDKLSL